MVSGRSLFIAKGCAVLAVTLLLSGWLQIATFDRLQRQAGVDQLSAAITLDSARVAGDAEDRRDQVINSCLIGFALGGWLLVILGLRYPAKNRLTDEHAEGVADKHGAAGHPQPLVLGASLVAAHLVSVAASYNAIQPRSPWLVEMGTLALITLLLCLELSILAMTRFRATYASSGAVGLNYKLMRPAMFLFLFGIDLSMAFLPLHMDQLATPVAGLSRELLLSFPISVEFLCVGIAMLMTGSWIDRRGWQPPFLSGLLLVVAGSLYSWLAGDAWHFIASRAVLGLGYGMTLLAAKSFVIRSTTHTEKAQGLSHLFAGVYSGSICGAVVGAMMANRWGYGPVFLIGALIVTLVILYAWLVYRAAMQNSGTQQALSRPAATSTITLGQFLRDRRIVAVILFSSMPGSIAAIGFLNYFSPVYLSRLQVTEVTIGQILMLFGVCLTLFAPPIGKLVDQLDNKRLSILLGGLLACLGFLVFNLADGVVAVTVAVILLGLSNCFVLSAQSAYFLRLKVTQQLGEGKALGVFRASSRLGQMLGPTLFAGLYAVTDTQYLMTCFGLAYLATTLLFLMLTRARPDEMPQTGLRMT